MANTKNNYGRQIFLSREEIRFLRDLVSREIVSLNDNMQEVEEALDPKYIPEHTDVKFWEEQQKDIEHDLEVAHKLVGRDDKPDTQGKLWYYVAASEVTDNG